MSQRTEYKIQYPEQQGLTFLNAKGEWVVGVSGATGPGLPVGGVEGQVASKVDGVDHHTHWRDVWPVGVIFMAQTSTNPANLLGFGTWVLLGAGNLTLT